MSAPSGKNLQETAVFQQVRRMLMELPPKPAAHSSLRHYSGRCKTLCGLEAALCILAFFGECYAKRFERLNLLAEGHLVEDVVVDEEDAVLNVTPRFHDRRFEGGGYNIVASAHVCRTRADRYFVVCDDIEELDDVVRLVEGSDSTP